MNDPLSHATLPENENLKKITAMTLQTQPPPDAPASPLQEGAIPSRKKWGWLKAFAVLAILFALAGLTAPMTFRCRKKADQTEAVNNARQIGLALFEFETEYGSFPDATTIEPVREATESTLTMGTASSNDFFRQLIAAGPRSKRSDVLRENRWHAETGWSVRPWSRRNEKR